MVDGEIVVVVGDRLEFEVLQQRIHPAASRVKLLSEQTPASFIAFDLLALGRRRLHQAAVRGTSRRARAGAQRRSGADPPDPDHPRPRRWPRSGSRSSRAPGWTGSWPSRSTGTYQPDKRTMFKIKHQRTADCVVAGYRVHKSGPDSIGSLLLGLYNDAGALASVGVIGAFPAARRKELFTELQPLVTTFDDHPWAWAKQEERHPDPAELRRQPLERRQGSLLRAPAPGAGGRGPLRAHGGRPLPPHRPVQPLAARPRADARARTSSSRSRSSTTWPTSSRLGRTRIRQIRETH